ncbi:hypothetical protein RQP53_05360, partial [Paucibacter sp. APW11]
MPDGDVLQFDVTKVDVYNDGVFVGTATLGASGATASDIPYRDFSYTHVGGFSTSGSHSLGVKAYDTGSNTGAAAGAVETITVSVSANASPTGAIASPLNGAVVPLNTPVLLSATASDSDGS